MNGPVGTSLADQLYAALKLTPCRCLKRWGNEGELVTIQACSRCIAIERYEAENSAPVVEEDTARWVHE